MHSPGFQPRNRLVECAVCGQTWRFSDMRKGVMGKQKGLDVCPRDFDPVHPNEREVPYRKEGDLDEVR